MTMDKAYQGLKNAANAYFDVQDFRNAMENKARSGQADIELVSFAADRYREIEAHVSRIMVTEMRQAVPLQVRAWQKASPGIGEHLLAKLLGVIGDPYVAQPMRWEDRPGAAGGKDDPKRVLVAGEPYVRNVAKLWAICGVGDPARKRRAGMTTAEAAALGNPKAKATMRLLAESCTKQPGSHYEIVYREARERYAARVHAQLCAQCKDSSAAGEPWRPGHQHSAALRLVAKEILRDLWEAAREAHTDIPPRGQRGGDAQYSAAPGRELAA